MSRSGTVGRARPRPHSPRRRSGVLGALLCVALGACGPPLPAPAPAPGSGAPTAVTRGPVPPPPVSAPAPVGPDAAAARSPGPARPAARVARVQPLGPAAAALVRQARAQSAVGEFSLAAATLERALRIEPDHPRLWLELGDVRQAQHNYPQAEVMGRKALAAADDHATQALAWRVIAASLKAQRREREAAEALANARRLDADS